GLRLRGDTPDGPGPGSDRLHALVQARAWEVEIGPAPGWGRASFFLPARRAPGLSREAVTQPVYRVDVPWLRRVRLYLSPYRSDVRVDLCDGHIRIDRVGDQVIVDMPRLSEQALLRDDASAILHQASQDVKLHLVE